MISSSFAPSLLPSFPPSLPPSLPHSETLAKLGWTTEEFEDGSKHDKAFSQETVGALRRINEGLIRRQTIMLGGEDEEEELKEKIEQLADRSVGK